MSGSVGRFGHVIFINGVQGVGKSTVARLVARAASTFEVVSGDDVIRRAPTAPRHPEELVTFMKELFAKQLEELERRSTVTNVVFDGALTEAQVTTARHRFRNTGMFVVLRVRESDRAAREKARREREGRRLTYSFRTEWHEMLGPDELYDVVVDTSSLSAEQAAQTVRDAARDKWENLVA